MKKIIYIILCLFTLTACSQEVVEEDASEVVAVTVEESDKFYGPLHVQGQYLVDADNNPVVLKGVSLHAINWFSDFVNEDLFNEIATKTDINLIRVPMYTSDYAGYLAADQELRDNYYSLIDDAINYAVENQMYVIIDWHTLNDNNPYDDVDEALAFFTDVVELYGDIDNVIFEICNEPNGDTTWNDISDYANIIIPQMRLKTDNVILVGTPNWSQDVDVASEAPLSYSNIMYTLHFYSATHKSDLRDKAQLAIDNELPIFVSEFGVSEADGNGEMDIEEANLWIDFLNDNYISRTIWNLSNKDETSALLNNDVYRYSGYTEFDLKESALWYINSKTPTLDNVILNVEDDKDENVSDDDSEVEDKIESNVVEKEHLDTDKIEGETKTKDNLEANDDVIKENSEDISDNKTNEDTPIEENTNNENVVEEVDVTLRESWEGGAIYIGTITPNKDVSNWKITIKFDQDIDVTDHWNCDVNVNGDTVMLTPLDYNINISKGSEVSDIGIIIDNDKAEVKSIVLS